MTLGIAILLPASDTRRWHDGLAFSGRDLPLNRLPERFHHRIYRLLFCWGRVIGARPDLGALVARSYLPEEASRDPAAIKAAIEGVIADMVFELEAERSTP